MATLTSILRILTVSEVSRITKDKAAKDILEHPGIWWLIDPDNDNEGVIFESESGIIKFYAASASTVAWVRPVLIAPGAGFNIGEMFLFGKDTAGLPLRWVGINKNILILFDHAEHITDNRKAIHYCDPKIGNSKYEISLVRDFLEKIFFTTAFTAAEQEAIRTGNFVRMLRRFSGEIVIPEETETIPYMRYAKDQSVKSLVISPRKKPLKIFSMAFAESRLNKIIGLEYVSEIETRAFYGADLEGELRFGNIQKIGGMAFAINNIQKLCFNGVVGDIDREAFYNNQIVNIDCSDGFLKIDSKAFSENYVDEETREKVTESVMIEYADDIFSEQGVYL